MIGYVRVEDVAEKWDVSPRQVQRLCNGGYIEGAIKFGTTWAIPKDAQKPTRTGKLKPGRKTKTSEVEQHEQK